MPMPRGHKCAPYVTLKRDGHKPAQFRRIAAVMTERGFKMNHATARAVTLSGLCKFASTLTGNVDDIKLLANDVDFQQFIGDLLIERDERH
jgi:hypothetical protein